MRKKTFQQAKTMTLLSYQLKILPLKKLITKTSKSYLSTMADVYILVQEKLILIQKKLEKTYYFVEY